MAEAAAKEMKGLQLQHAPKGSHASNGAAERAILEVARQVRTLVHALETRYPGYRLKTEGHVFPWLVRHASWLITRFLVKDDGRTPYERLRGRDYKGEIVDYAEVVHYKLEAERVGKLDPQASVGVWLGKSLSSDEHLIGTSQGIRRCRSIWRRPENKRWEQARLNAVTGTPWQPKGRLTIVPQDNQRLPAPGTPAPGTPGGGRQRSVYITVERQIKHGPTPGCPGCHCSDDDPKKHSKACRLRFESIYHKSGEGEADAGGPAQSADAGSTAQQGTKRSNADAGSPAQESEAATGSADRKGTKRAGEALEAERKGLKENPKTGEKRAAPDEDPTFMELLNGLPTLHDAPQTVCRDLLAAYPEHGRLEAAYDEKTGESLPLDKVKRARGRELDKMAEHQVKRDITYEEARKRDLKIVKSRWVDGWKALPDDPQGVRSRCVAQEVNTHPGTPPLKAHRMVISHAATRRSGERENKKLIGRYDVSVGFFHAESTGKIAVVPPKDVDEGQLWYLLKAMNGTREASKQWAMRISGTKKKYGFAAVASVLPSRVRPDAQLPW